MSHYAKGRRAEYRARNILRAEGCIVIRAAGSKGPFDLVALGNNSIRLVQVKYNIVLTQAERDDIAAITMPQGVTKEVWTFARGSSEPVIVVI